MKKLFFALAIASLTFNVSCSNEETQTTETNLQARDGRPQIPTEKQKADAIADVEYEVIQLTTVPRHKPKASVEFCGNPDFSQPSGGGFAKVTLADNTVHYVSYSWFKDSLNQTIVATKYEGMGSAPAGSLCS